MSTKKRSTRISTSFQGEAGGDTSALNSSGSLLETSRAQEKDQLSGLNSRLAMYIDRVRQLETENRRLQVQIRDVEVIEKKERGNLAEQFDNEKKRLRALIDDLEKREARAAIERDTATAEHERLLARVAKLERDLSKAEEDRLSALGAADDATAKQRTIQAHLDKANAELKDVTRERNRLASQLSTLQKTLEDEVLQKTVAQNELARLTEDIAFLKKQHQSQLEEVRHKRQVDMTTYQKQVTQEFQSKLQDQLAEMRAQFQEQRAQSNTTIEERYKNKLNEAQEARDRALNESAKLRSRVRELEVSDSSSSTLLEALRKELRDLKQQMADRMADKDSRISELNDEIARLLAEFHNLLDIKIQLDTELNTYRMLLEGEEERLNLSSASQGGNVVTHHASFTTGTGSAQRGVKRRRVEINGDEGELDYHRFKERMQKETTGPVGIDEVDPDGNWVRILNSSDEEVSLGKWSLVVRAGGIEVTYRFNNRMKLGANATYTVHSAGSQHGHVTDGVVMKNQSWPIGENPSARLEDSEGDVVSTVTLEASESTDPSDPQDRCSLM